MPRTGSPGRDKHKEAPNVPFHTDILRLLEIDNRGKWVLAYGFWTMARSLRVHGIIWYQMFSLAIDKCAIQLMKSKWFPPECPQRTTVRCITSFLQILRYTGLW